MLALVRRAFTGRYEVEREIGKGGNARIYLARDPGGQPVALKILHPELLVSVAADRFLREIRLASQLDHPHIAKIARLRRAGLAGLLRHDVRGGADAAGAPGTGAPPADRRDRCALPATCSTPWTTPTATGSSTAT